MHVSSDEVYVIFADYDTAVDVTIVDDFGDALEHLKTLDPEDHFETKVLHGVAAPGDVLPSDLLDNDCFLIVLTPNCGIDGKGLRGTVFETDAACNPSLLAKEIEELVNEDSRGLVFNPDIEDILVMYGYEVELGLCINEDSVDEEKTDSCKRIVEETIRIRKGAG
jgi:hypothetical protein